MVKNTYSDTSNIDPIDIDTETLENMEDKDASNKLLTYKRFTQCSNIINYERQEKLKYMGAVKKQKDIIDDSKDYIHNLEKQIEKYTTIDRDYKNENEKLKRELEHIKGENDRNKKSMKVKNNNFNDFIKKMGKIPDYTEEEEKRYMAMGEKMVGDKIKRKY